MVDLLIVLGVLAALTAAFWVLVREHSEEEVGFWTVLGIVFCARGGVRLIEYVFPIRDALERAVFSGGVYIFVLTIGLVLGAKVRPLVALMLAIGFSIAAIVVSMLLVAYVLPHKSGTP